MKQTDNLWIKKWSHTKYPYIINNYQRYGWGSTDEPESSIWLSSLSEGLSYHFKEGMKVLDYGCGSARYANFLSARILDFKYYGLEISGGEIANTIPETIRLLGHDKRVNVGLIGTELEQQAINECDGVILGSIFTHLRFCDFMSIMDKFKPIIKRGGCVSFSVFIDDHEWTTNDGKAYGIENCYGLSYYTEKQMSDYCNDNNYILTYSNEFLAQGVNAHKIFRIEAS